jgi:hypothetical protein
MVGGIRGIGRCWWRGLRRFDGIKASVSAKVEVVFEDLPDVEVREEVERWFREEISAKMLISRSGCLRGCAKP